MLYFLILFILIICSLAYLKIAERYNIIDKPNQRSSHTTLVIRGGGVLFYFAILLFYFINNFQYLYFVFGVSLIAIVSFIDDIITLSSKVRFPFQFLAILLLLVEVGFVFNPIWLFILLLIIGVGFINVYNFMDGVNGITGMYSISVLFGFYALNIDAQIVNQDLIIYTLLSLAVFGYYNFRRKARFFAGDVGSISIAMLLFFIGLSLINETGSPMIALLVVVYGADSLLTLVYRIYLKEHITEAHRHHLYQKLVDVLQWSHLKVSMVYTMIQVLVNIVVLKTYKLGLEIQFLLFLTIVFVFIGSYILIFRRIKLKD